MNLSVAASTSVPVNHSNLFNIRSTFKLNYLPASLHLCHRLHWGLKSNDVSSDPRILSTHIIATYNSCAFCMCINPIKSTNQNVLAMLLQWPVPAICLSTLNSKWLHDVTQSQNIFHVYCTVMKIWNNKLDFKAGRGHRNRRDAQNVNFRWYWSYLYFQSR